ncbi:MAG: hypothetical protein IT259_15095, partial [Saprospiraceae bacterium]|nr:hypothetical protein [Saprospiraceae bacterium]
MKQKKSKPKTESPTGNTPKSTTKKTTQKKTSTQPATKTAQPGTRTTRPKGVPLQPDNNRLLSALEGVSFRNKSALKTIVRHTPHQPVELAPTFHAIYGRNPEQAARLAETFATTLDTSSQHRELFQQASQLPVAERRALIQGYRKAGQARGVVHAISQLPRGQGRILMRDFLIKKEDKKVDNVA